MGKTIMKSSTVMGPLPVVLVGCGTVEEPNVMTAAWTGIVNSDPPMAYVSVRPSRYSHDLMEKTGEFTLNPVSSAMVRTLDSCGVLTGAKVDKFKKFSLTPIAGTKVGAPLVEQAPLGLECRIARKIPLGSHDMYLATIEALVVDDELIDEKGKLRLEKAKLIAYSHGDYMALGRKLGSFGFSVRNHKKTSGKG